jgi:molybdate transport system substrate-binding protein
MKIRKLALLGALWLLGPEFAWPAEVPIIAAASDLQFVLTEIAARFEEHTSEQVRLTYGSSGTFTAQIENGAPFELFLSADEDYIFQLADKGLTKDRGILYARGRIVLFAPHGSGIKIDGELHGLRAALADGRIQRFAIANPDHAPYGRAAKAVLRHAGLWSILKPKLVMGENALQAMQFAASGSSQGGIVPLSLSMAAPVAKLGRFALIPVAWHAEEPLRQRMVLLKGAGDVATAFYKYLQNAAARQLFIRYGFVLPGDTAQ